MKKVLFLFGMIILVVGLDAQSTINFSKIYGTAFCDDPVSVVTTAQGGYAMGGYTTAHEHEGNFLLVVTDAAGDTLWTREYDSGGMDKMKDMKRTADGGYVMVGLNSGPVNSDWNVLVVKTDASGAATWSNAYGVSAFSSEYPEEIIQTSDGGYAIAGWDDTNGFILKVDAAGVFQWLSSFSSPNGFGSRMLSLAETSNGDLIGAGALFVSNSQKLLLVSVGASGTLNWSKSISGSDNYWPSSIVLHTNGSIYVGGTANLYTGGSEQMFMMHFNNAGALQFTNHYDVLQYGEESNSLIEIPTGDLCMAGVCWSTPYDLAVAFRISQAGVASSVYYYLPSNYRSGFADAEVAGDGGIALLAGPYSAFGVPDTASFNLIKVDGDLSSSCSSGSFANSAVSKTCVDLPEAMQILSGGTSNAAPVITAAGLYIIDVCSNVGIEESESGESNMVYPQPAQSQFTIELNGQLAADHPEFVLFDARGREVKREVISSARQTIACGDLAVGIYYYQLLNNGTLAGSGKLLKE